MRTISTEADVVSDAYHQIARLADVEWVAGRADDDALVVLFRRTSGGADEVPIEGVRVPTGAAAGTDHAHACEALLEIEHSDGTATRLDVPWADGLLLEPGSVRWSGGAVTQAAHYALGRLGSSAQGCSGSPL